MNEKMIKLLEGLDEEDKKKLAYRTMILPFKIIKKPQKIDHGEIRVILFPLKDIYELDIPYILSDNDTTRAYFYSSIYLDIIRLNDKKHKISTREYNDAKESLITIIDIALDQESHPELINYLKKYNEILMNNEDVTTGRYDLRLRLDSFTAEEEKALIKRREYENYMDDRLIKLSYLLPYRVAEVSKKCNGDEIICKYAEDGIIIYGKDDE